MSSYTISDMKTVEQVATTRPYQHTEMRTTRIDNETSPQTYEKRKTIFRAHQIVWFLVGMVEVFLGFRFLLKLLGANLSTFTSLVYAMSSPFASPFLGTLSNSRAGDVVIEWSTLLAMAVYPLLAMGIMKAFQFIKPTTPQEVERKIDK
jgi:hypothetical protein